MAEAALPLLEIDPYGERMDLQRCHVGRPISPVPVEEASRELAPTARRLLDDLAGRSGFAVEHGKTESIICYRGYRIGGIHPAKGHWFVSDSLATHVVRRFLHRLGFQLGSGRFGSAKQQWYEIGHLQVDAYRHAIEQIAFAIDRQVGPA